MLATLRCDHPDIERFIDAKCERGALRNYNLSVLGTGAVLGDVPEAGESVHCCALRREPD